MGITWVYDDAREAYQANTETVPSPGGRAPVNFLCPFCSSTFTEFSSMQRHASSQHQLRRPLLMWRGHEVGRERKIATPGEFKIANCTRAIISVDRAAEETIDIAKLEALLGSATNASVRVRLENRPDKKMAAAVSSYRLEFRIADTEALSQVEEAFQEYLVRAIPNPDRIRIFLEDPRCTGVGEEYASGLYAYVHALLLKEGAGDNGFISAYALHTERFGEALQKLEGMDRKLARSVCSLVRLIRNDLSGDGDPGLGQIGVAYDMLRGPDVYGASVRGSVPAGELPLCPIDHGTSRIIALANRLADADRWSAMLREECRTTASDALLHADDHRKVFAYWAVTALRLGDRGAARYALQQIASIYPFDGWASAALAGNGSP
ncbi:hypothetical protein ASG43_09250 [Aureimonas sp. Leaf454]|uniref:hypothetical protein n=1 Tax=Aureimonas sp. Leaf454 TaxID=1736381 RepID=UPI0006F3040F|nr:hypothetical protein [Aureimonas sp. Leaf454]KQT49007.1 hypothetical protein ASG43_09250 [Aureimonas sp. Leaf454]